MIFTTISMVCATSITINSTNNTLKNVVNNYDTIYLDDGVYKGASNRNVNISRNTTIIGVNKGGAIFDDEFNSSSFNIKPNFSLTLINLTFTNKFSDIYNQGSLTINNCNFTNNYPFDGLIRNSGILRIYDSSFNNNYNVLINSFTGNDIIRNCEFNNNQGDIDGIIVFKGKNRLVSLVNSTFSNNSAPTGLIVIAGDYVNMDVSNCSFVNSKCNLFAITGGFAPSTGSKIEPSNIIEINTTINYNPNIFVGINLKKNGVMTFKATLRDKYGMILSDQRLYFMLMVNF